MNSLILFSFATLSRLLSKAFSKTDERGEGVVSAAIAVVIFSTLGVAMWLAFRSTMNTATSMVTSQVQQLAN